MLIVIASNIYCSNILIYIPDLCAKKISQRDREKCDTLDYEDGKAITPAILDKHLELPNGGRQKRMVRIFSTQF